jgi:site-specific recombinase XerD
LAEFLAWCDDSGVPSITAVRPLPVAAWIEIQQQERAASAVKAQLAALRHLFDWLVMDRLDRVIALFIVLLPMARSSRSMTLCV